MSKIGDAVAKAAVNLMYKYDVKQLTKEAHTMTYKLMKRVVEAGLKKGNLDVESTMMKLDVFLMANRITVEEYQELVELMNGSAE